MVMGVLSPDDGVCYVYCKDWKPCRRFASC